MVRQSQTTTPRSSPLHSFLLPFCDRSVPRRRQEQRLALRPANKNTRAWATIKAVRKYENTIEFPETNKLCMVHKPKATSVTPDDGGHLNRLIRIPCTVACRRYRIRQRRIQRVVAEESILDGGRRRSEARVRGVGLNHPPIAGGELRMANRDWLAGAVSCRALRYLRRVHFAGSALYGRPIRSIFEGTKR